MQSWIQCKTKQTRGGERKVLLKDQRVLDQNEKLLLTLGLFRGKTWHGVNAGIHWRAWSSDGIPAFWLAMMIKSEELPASEHTMCTENCSSKKSEDGLQLLVTTVQIQWLGKRQYTQGFFFILFLQEGVSACFWLSVGRQSSSHRLTCYFILTILIFQMNKSNFTCVTGPLLEGDVHV